MERIKRFFFDRHLDDDEEIVDIVHKHWIVGLKELVWPIVSFLAAWVFLYMAPFLTVFYISALWAVLSLVWFLRNFFDYYLDAWILTNEGIIDIEWHGWFHRQSARVLYSDIQGVSYEIQGISSTLMRYGAVTVEKISNESTITLEDVPSPKRVENMILKNMEEYLHSKNLRDAKHVQNLLSEIVAREIHTQDFEEEDDEEYEDDDDE